MDSKTTPESIKNISELEIPEALLHYLSSEECNLRNICRICLSTSNKAKFPLTSTTEEYSILANMFTTITSIHVIADDKISCSICSYCQNKLVQCYNFKTKCENSHYMLQYILKSHYSFNNELKTEVEVIDKEDIKSEEMLNYTNDYPDDFEDILSDDEALCIVQETIRNEKKYTIFERDHLKHQVTEMIVPLKKQKRLHECSICLKVFHRPKRLEAHVMKHHHHQTADRPFPCASCKHAYNSEKDLELHRLIHSEGPWKCTSCDKPFKGRTELRRHIQRHMESKRFSCSACGKQFVERCALQRHARVHSGERAEKRHGCTDCGKRFSDNSQLMVHMSRHSGDKPFQCVVCGKAFPSSRLLASHRLVHSDLRPYACEYCDKRFRHESTRNTHHRTHTGEKPYICSVCGKSFIQNSNMRLHMRTHTGEKPYACGRCGSRFSSGSTLKSHERTHTGDRPYICNVCGKSFARLNVKLHMRLHSGERPFACSACPKKYVSASLLRDHCRAHTGEKPFECATCESKFTSKGLLIKHLRAFENSKSKRKHFKEIPIIDQDDTNDSEVVIVPMDKIDPTKTKSDQLVPDPSVLNAIADPSVVNAIIDPNVPNAIADPSVPNALSNPSVSNAFAKLGVSNAKADPSAPNAISDRSVPNAIVELTLGMHEPYDVTQELVLQDEDIKTHVIVLGSSGAVSFVSNGSKAPPGVDIVNVKKIRDSMASNANS